MIAFEDFISKFGNFFPVQRKPNLVWVSAEEVRQKWEHRALAFTGVIDLDTGGGRPPVHVAATDVVIVTRTSEWGSKNPADYRFAVVSEADFNSAWKFNWYFPTSKNIRVFTEDHFKTAATPTTPAAPSGILPGSQALTR